MHLVQHLRASAAHSVQISSSIGKDEKLEHWKCLMNDTCRDIVHWIRCPCMPSKFLLWAYMSRQLLYFTTSYLLLLEPSLSSTVVYIRKLSVGFETDTADTVSRLTRYSKSWSKYRWLLCVYKVTLFHRGTPLDSKLNCLACLQVLSQVSCRSCLGLYASRKWIERSHDILEGRVQAELSFMVLTESRLEAKSASDWNWTPA